MTQGMRERCGRRVAAALAGSALVLSFTSGCDGGGQTDGAGHRPTIGATVTKPALDTALMDDLLRQVQGTLDTAVKERPAGSVVTTAGARPTVIERDGRAQVMNIRDEAHAIHDAGRYRIVVYCSGVGTLVASAAAGDVVSGESTIPCTESGAVGEVTFDLPTAANELVVTIAPSADAVAAVAYLLETQ